MGEAILSVDNLKTYFRVKEGLAKAVDGVSFQIHRGETLGLVGDREVAAVSPAGRSLAGYMWANRAALLHRTAEHVVLAAAALVLGVEWVLLRDTFYGNPALARMNTIFKFYFQAWVLWGVAGAYALVGFIRRGRVGVTPRGATRRDLTPRGAPWPSRSRRVTRAPADDDGPGSCPPSRGR